jgi:vitamin B12 transporter
MTPTAFRSLAAAALAGAVHAALAQTPQTLEEIVITARSIEETLAVELADYGHDVEMVSADRINAAGYLDVSTALQYEVPGLFLSPEAGPFTYVDISVQGSRTGDVLWLLDGVRFNNRIFNTTTPDTMPAGMVERIEVLKGGESLFYGTQGVAGAVNIVTRSFSDDPDGELVLSADSQSGYQLGGYGRGALGDHKFVFYGSKNESDGYEQFDIFQPSATDRERGYDVENLGVKYGYDFSERARLDLLYHHTDGVLDFLNPHRSKIGYNDRDEDVASLKLALDVADSVELLIKGYLHDWDTHYANIQNAPLTFAEVVVSPPGSYWGFRDYGASALVKVTPDQSAAEYHVGYDYQNYEARDDVFPIAGETESVNALFAHVRSAEGAFERGSMAAGVRYNRATSGKSATVWNLSGRYDIRGDALYLQGMLSTAFLLPSAEQLYYVGFPPDDYAGNPNLEPEESENINVSLGGRFMRGDSAFGWQVTAFARDIDNLININEDQPVTTPYGTYDLGQYENVLGTVEVRGAEASISLANDVGLRFDVSHTYTKSRMEGSQLQLARTPIRFTKVGLGYAPDGRRYEVTSSINIVGDVFQSVGAFGRRNFGEYNVLNLAARVSLDSADRHRLGFSLQNVTDEEYATRLISSQVDTGGTVLVRRLGLPRTISASYTVDF